MSANNRHTAARLGSGKRGNPAEDPGIAWIPTTVRRAAGPPLRFKGCEVSCHGTMACLGVAITLWQRKSGGFVAAVLTGEREDAVSTKTLDEAMTWLEEICRLQAGAPLTPSEIVPNQLPVQVAASRKLRLLAGQAMAAWDVWQDKQAEQEQRK